MLSLEVHFHGQHLAPVSLLADHLSVLVKHLPHEAPAGAGVAGTVTPRVL